MGQKQHSPVAQMLMTFGYMGIWICLSALVIMINKYILDPTMGAFPFPLAVTSIHMAFCSALSWGLVKGGYVTEVPIPMSTYISCVLPVGGLFAMVLWLGNTAYLYLSVSFIQMLKAMMPILVYVTACLFNMDTPSTRSFVTMALVASGVFIASYAEVVFNLVGVLCQVSSCVFEALRLILVQILLQRRGIKLNPITTMCHVAPACLMFLLVPLVFVEGGRLMEYSDSKVGPLVLLLSAASAFGLNCAVFLLIGKSSALTMNIAGVVKDLLLIGLSVGLYKSIVTSTQMAGYVLALAGVFYYNYQKFMAAQAAQAPADAPAGQHCGKGAAATGSSAGMGGPTGDSAGQKDQEDEESPLLKQQDGPPSPPSRAPVARRSSSP